MDFSPLRSVLRDAADLVFPRSCAGCGAWDQTLCPECSRALAGAWVEVSARAAGLQIWRPLDAPVRGLEWPGDEVPAFAVWALGDYDGVRRSAILRWKNVVDGLLNEAMGTLARTRARQFAPVLAQVGFDAVDLVPAPSSPERKRDGRFVAGHLAQAFAAGLAEGGIDASVADVLATRARRGSRNMGARRAKSRAIVAARPGLRGVPAIVVDDVLTTGATLFGCGAALEEAGAQVAGALVLAAAPDPRGAIRQEGRARDSLLES